MSIVKVLPEVTQFLKKEYSHFINGEFIKGSGESISIENPATETKFHTVFEANKSEIDSAVEGAFEAFHGSWKATSPKDRSRLLNLLADKIEENSEMLAQIEVLSAGKNVNVARFEMAQSVDFTRYYAGWATKLAGETVQSSIPSLKGERYMGMTLREPIGVVGGIIPWNFPILIAIWKIAAALTTGCTIVVKPSEYTPISTLVLAKLAFDVGIPKGVFNVVNGKGNVGKALIENDKISKISFTGSVPTGINIGKSAISAKLTRFTLELGGKNPAAFFNDLTTDEIVAGIIEGAMGNQGQICAAIERAYIHEDKIDEVIAKLPIELGKIKISDPFDESAMFSTLANKMQYEKTLAYYEKAKNEGDEIICGAHKIDGKGYFVPPTIIRAKEERSLLMCEETFSPTVTIFPFSDEGELVRMMNDTPFGLTASIWTKDYSRAMRLINDIKAGTVTVNTHGTLDPALPFGGIKSSGIGREFGSVFIDDYTEIKTVLMRI